MTTNYNELVDYQVSTMKPNPPDQINNESPPFVPKTVSTTERKSFDELYEEYSSKSIDEQIENLEGLGRELVSKIDKIIDQIDVILEGDKKD